MAPGNSNFHRPGPLRPGAEQGQTSEKESEAEEPRAVPSAMDGEQLGELAEEMEEEMEEEEEEEMDEDKMEEEREVRHERMGVLNAKKKLFQNLVFSKGPADSTCLHPGVPNCSTLSP